MVRQWVEVIAFAAYNSSPPNTPLKAEGQFTARNSVMIVITWGCSPRVIVSLMVPSGVT